MERGEDISLEIPNDRRRPDGDAHQLHRFEHKKLMRE
jgi:hypothetical protein